MLAPIFDVANGGPPSGNTLVRRIQAVAECFRMVGMAQTRLHLLVVAQITMPEFPEMAQDICTT